MKTIWFSGKDEEKLVNIAEEVGAELITRNCFVELIVHSEVREILGRGLNNDEDGNSEFAIRLGFLGNLLHRNSVFALIVSPYLNESTSSKIKEEYGNFIHVSFDKSDKDPVECAEEIIKDLDSKKLIPFEESGTAVYSKDEEEEIRRRLEELGYV